MPTPTENFVDNPVAFMRQNVVTVDINLTLGGIYRFKLESKDEYTADLEATGAPIGVYQLQRDNNIQDTFESYWLPYQNDRMFHLELRNNAKFLFTPRMDGCTFAASDIQEQKTGFIGLFSKKQHFMTVSHLNMQQQNGEVDQHLMDFMVRRLHGNARTKVLKRSNYLDPVMTQQDQRDTTYKTTTFGVRKSGKWKFYFQCYRDNMGSYTLAGLGQL